MAAKWMMGSGGTNTAAEMKCKKLSHLLNIQEFLQSSASASFFEVVFLNIKRLFNRQSQLILRAKFQPEFYLEFLKNSSVVCSTDKILTAKFETCIKIIDGIGRNKYEMWKIKPSAFLLRMLLQEFSQFFFRNNIGIWFWLRKYKESWNLWNKLVQLSWNCLLQEFQPEN